eukprot:CAMPEP_0195283668 /NCGR_PEP_ID=MMETSP0707-20130614/2139_1 /TAXON_ID=33640 /ORGANISM="Asterionellopsis glacialis, Strain CCMP134" /LENGTH=523 /DNA_ID=CAMNT_0040342875 /DNA_START=41 /DNA_END=1615 /DNA_ORIENTATION=+
MVIDENKASAFQEETKETCTVFSSNSSITSNTAATTTTNNIIHNNPKKRKADVLGRLEQSKESLGRGALTGWTTCPLCAGISKKKFALGRGIAAHLHAVHTPWKPGKAELRKRRRLEERRQMERKRKKCNNNNTEICSTTPNSNNQQDETDESRISNQLTSWEPTLEEQEQWDQKVLAIAAELEEKARQQQAGNNQSLEASSSSTTKGDGSSVIIISRGLDRNGNESHSYRDSLPTFIQAAADGMLDTLVDLVNNCKTKNAAVLEMGDDGNANIDGHLVSIHKLLETRDRNGSTAEHWAAGEGHLHCLQYLFELRSQTTKCQNDGNNTIQPSKEEVTNKKIRRRDGKTCLHYAARNGRLDCIRYLLSTDKNVDVDEMSGDGTTPIHMACYGGHPEAVRLLLQHGASLECSNEWGCGVAHWVGMTRCESKWETRDLCNLLLERGISYAIPQKQGHTALHKAAQRKNRHVIEWMSQRKDEGGAGLSEEDQKKAGLPDKGGHKPSDIWKSVGGQDSFAKWMKGLQW